MKESFKCENSVIVRILIRNSTLFNDFAYHVVYSSTGIVLLSSIIYELSNSLPRMATSIVGYGWTYIVGSLLHFG